MKVKVECQIYCMKFRTKLNTNKFKQNKITQKSRLSKINNFSCVEKSTPAPITREPRDVELNKTWFCRTCKNPQTRLPLGIGFISMKQVSCSKVVSGHRYSNHFKTTTFPLPPQLVILGYVLFMSLLNYFLYHCYSIANISYVQIPVVIHI